MAFNFQQLLTAFSNILPTIGTLIEDLHPGDDQEAAKIAVGTQVIQSLIAALATGGQTVTPVVAPAISPAVTPVTNTTS